MVNKTPTPLLIDTAILSQIVTDILDVAGAPSTKKSACLNKAAARIAGPKHNFGYLTGRDKPLVANDVHDYEIMSTEDAWSAALTSLDAKETTSETQGKSRPRHTMQAQLARAFASDHPALFIGGTRGDEKSSYLETLGRSKGYQVIYKYLADPSIAFNDDGTIARWCDPDRHNKTISVYHSVGALSAAQLKGLEKELYKFLGERTKGMVVFMSNNCTDDLAKIRKHAPGILNNSMQVIPCSNPSNGEEADYDLLMASTSAPLSKSDYEDVLMVSRNDKKHAGESDVLGLRRIAEIETASNPSINDITRTIRNDVRLSSRVADYLDANASLAQAALDCDAIKATTWIDLASVVASIDTASESITWSDAKQATVDHLKALLRITVKAQLGVMGASFSESFLKEK
jgi:hypothetical protein